MVSRTRGMVSKRSSEWSVKSRSSLTWIDAPKTVEAEHGGPWYIVRYDNPPMVLNPSETSSYTLLRSYPGAEPLPPEPQVLIWHEVTTIWPSHHPGIHLERLQKPGCTILISSD